MVKELKQGILFTVVAMVLLGGVYHLVLWGIGRVLFASQAEGSLIRVLGVVERRGYKLQGLSVMPVGPDSYRLSFSVESVRDVSMLVKQLERLFDVFTVQLVDAGRQQPRQSVELQQMQSFQASWLAS